MKKITLLPLLAIILLCVNVKLLAQPTYSNTITLTTGNSIPLGGNVTTGQCMQNIFLPGEFTGGPFNGLITTIYYRSSTSITTATARTYTNFTIKMGQTAATTLTASTWVTAGMTQVYLNPSLSLTWPISSASNPWVQIVLQTPFVYDPSQSLIVEVGHAGITPTTSFFPIMNQSLSGIRRVWAGVPNNPPPVTFSGADANCPSFGFDEIPNGPCTDPPTAGTSTAIPSTVCSSAPATLNLTGNSTGTGQTYQWFSSTLIGGPYTTTVSGVLSSSSFIINPTSTLYYRCDVTCGATTNNSVPVQVIVNPPLIGAYTINNTLPTSGTNYQTFSAAVNALNCQGVSGPVVFNVSAGQTFTEDVPIITATGTVANTITFQKSGAGANPIVKPTGGTGTTDAGISINGGDYFTFDGIDITVNTGTALEYGYYLSNNSATNGAQNNTIKNCTITLSRTVTTTRGILTNVVTVPTSAAGANSNNTFMDFTITNAYSGILLTGNATFPDLNNRIITSACNTYNIIGNPATPLDIGGGTLATAGFGISATSQSGVVIKNNKISNVATTGITDGILVTTFQGSDTIANNIINGVRCNSATSTSTVTGIRMSHTTTGTHFIYVYNNSVSNITSAYTGAATTTRSIKGIHVFGTGGVATTTYEIINNSVSIDGTPFLNLSNACFEEAAIVVKYIIRNNIFANFTGAQGATPKHYCFVNVGSATVLGGAGTSVQNNDLFLAVDSNVSGFTALGVATNRNGVVAWQTANVLATGNFSVSPNFVNNITDLHANNYGLNGTGVAYPAYLTVDLDCNARTLPADVGAYNNVGACAGTPIAGTVSGSSSAFCSGNSLIINAPSATNTGNITYQWVSSNVSGGPYSAVAGATFVPYNTGTLTTPALVTSIKYYKLVVTCVTSGLSDSSNQVSITIYPNPTSSITPVGPITACGNTTVLTANTTTPGATYQWQVGGVNIAGATNSTFIPFSSGTYTVVITDPSTPSACSTVSNGVVFTGILTPAITVTSNTSVCDGQTVNLSSTITNAVGATYTVSSIPFAPNASVLSKAGPTGDEGNVNAATGFSFLFFNVPFTAYTIHTNGQILMGASQTGANSIFSPPTIPAAALPNNWVGFWSDLNPLAALPPIDQVTWDTIGTTPSRKLIARWNQVNFFSATPFVTYQIELNEATNFIDVFLTSVNGVTNTKAIGIEDATGLVGISPPARNAGTWTATNEGWRFIPVPPSVTTFSWAPATGLSSTSIANPVCTPVLGTTIYTVTVTNTGMTCSNTATVAISNLGVNDPAPTTTSGSACVGASGHLAASGLSTLRWYTAQTGGTLKHIGATWDSVWTATTTYWVESFNGQCPSPRTSVTITVLQLPPTAATATPPTFCTGGSSQLNANVFISGSLATPTTTGNSSSCVGFDVQNISTSPITIHFLSFAASATGSLTETVYYNTTPLNCTAPANVTTAPGWISLGSAVCTATGLTPTMTLIPLDLNLTIPPGLTYAIAFGGASVAYNGTGTTCVLTPIASDANIVLKQGFGGTLTGTINFRSFVGTISYAYGDPNASVAWSPATGLNSTTSVNPIATPPIGTTIYTVSVTGTGGCTNSSTVSVTNLGIPDVAPTTTGDTKCAGVMAHLSASGTSTLNWYTAQTGGILKHTGSTWDSTWATTTTYWVESFNGICPSPRTSVTVTVIPIPPLTPTAAPSTICSGDTSQLDAGSFISGTLNTVLTSDNSFNGNAFDITATNTVTIHFFSMVIVAGTGQGQVWYKAGGYGNAPLTSSVGWTLAGTANITSTGPPAFACTGCPATLIPVDVNVTIPAGQTYGFVVVANISNGYKNGTAVGNTWASDGNITLKEGHGGSGFGGTFAFSNSPRNFVGNVTYSFGDPNLNFAWTPATGLNSTSIKSPKTGTSSTTIYTITATNTGGCSNSASVTVTVNPTPTSPTIDSVTNIFCGCGNATIYAHINSAGTIIRWFSTPTGGTPLGTGSPFITPLFCGPKTFYAEEFNSTTGCKSASRSPILITPTVAVPINAGTDAVLCNGAGPASLAVSSTNLNYNYTWSPAAGLNVTTGASVTSNPGINTTYIATGTDPGSGCVNKDTVTVFVGITPTISSVTAAPTNVCSGDTSQLNVIATIPGGSVIGFTGAYIPAGWTTTHSAGDLGTVNLFNASTLNMSSSDGGTGATDIDVTHTVTATGNITFNWSYTTVDGASFDYPQYYKNGVRTIIPGYSTVGATTQIGTASIPVVSGDVFGFNMHSVDNVAGAATADFSNVVFPGSTAAFAYSWSPSTGLTSTSVSNPKSVPPVGTTTYTVTVSNNGCTATGTISVTASLTPPAPAVVGDTVCGPDTVHVSAIPSNVGNSILWTDTIGGQIINTGTTYSKYVTKSGSFYVTEATGSGSTNVGYSGIDAATGFFPDIASFMNFTVMNSEGIIINSVMVSTNLGAGTWPLVVALVNTSGQIVSVHDTIFITGGSTALQTINLNMFVPQGSWRLQPIFNPNLSVHQLAAVTASLPWTIPGIINITCFGNASSACFSTATFGLFYYWNISTVCNSLQSIVSYQVNPSSPVGIASSGGLSFCNSASTTLSAVDSAGGIYETYTWAPATGLSATTGTSVTVSGLTQTTTYTLTANDNDANCHALATQTITIQPKPTLLLSFHDTTICRTEPSLPFNSTAAKSSVVQVGTRADANFVSGVVYGGNTTQFSQMILTPAELNAAGLFGPTNITSLAFFVSSKLTTTTYTIDIKMRADPGIPAVFPDANPIAALTTVYNNPSITSTLGWNTYNFSTPFNWDGVSNLLVSECFTHNIPGFFDIVFTSAVGVARFNAVNASACGGAGILLTDRPNIRFTGGTVFYSWTPGAGLSSATVEDPVLTPNFFGVDTALYYKLTVTDPLSGCTATDSIHVNISSTPPTPKVAFIGDSVLCFSGAPKMRAFGTSGSLQWQISTDSVNFTNISGAIDDTLNAASISATRYYRFFANCGDTAYSRVMTVVVNNPQIASSVPDTVCGFGQVCLSAAPNQPYYDVSWFSAATGGTLLGTGNNFCTNISSTTTFYAQAATSGGAPVTIPYFNYTTTLGANTFPFAQTAGKEVQWFVAPGEFVQPSAAPAGGMITSISFYAATAGNAIYNTFTVKLGQLASPYAGGALYTGPMTTVILPASKTIVTSVGTWVTLTLDVPFAYNPAQWLVVDVGHCGYTGTGFNVYQNTLTGIRRVWSVGGCPFVWNSNDATLPGITIGLTTGSQCLSTRVPVVAVSTPPPAMSTVAHTITICESSCGTIGVDSAGQANYQAFNWSPSTGLTTTTGASIQACPLTTTTYTVTAIDTLGSCQKTDTVRVIVNPAPTVITSSTPALICQGDSAQLSSGAGGGPPATVTMGPEGSLFPGNVRGYSFTAPANFTITGLQDLGSGAGLQSICVVKFIPPVPPPIFSLTTNAFTILYVTQNNANLGVIPVNIPVSAGDVIGVLSQRGTNTSYTNPVGPYVTTIAGLPVTLTRMGMQSPLTTTIPGSGTAAATYLWTETAAAVGRTQITYTSGTVGTSFAWSSPAGLSSTSVSNPKASPASTTTYTVTVTNTATGCTKSSTVTVNVTPRPQPYLMEGDSVLCSNDAGFDMHVFDAGVYSGGYPPNTIFNFYGAGAILYQSSTSNTFFNANNSDAFYCVVTLPPILGSCSGTSDTAVIDFGGTQAPQYVLASDSVKCFGGSTGNAIATITFGGAANYRWQWYSSGSNTLLRDVTNSHPYDSLKGVAAGMYILVLTDHQGATVSPYCQITDSVYVGEPAAPLSATENTGNHVNVLCFGNLTGSIDINVSGGTPLYSYNWSNGASTQDLGGIGAGTYTCTVTDSRGCTAVVTVIITQGAPVAPVITGNPSICAGNTNTLNAGAGYTSYLWSTGATTQSISVSTAGTYTVTVSIANGCTGSSSVTTVVNPKPVPTISGVSLICSGNTTAITANAGFSAYSWSTGATTQSITVPGGTYTVTVTNTFGCTQSATKTIVIVNGVTAQPGLITGPLAVCKNSNVTFSIPTVAGATGYTWTVASGATVSTGQGSTTVVINFSNAATSGTLTVVATNICGSSIARTLSYTVSSAIPTAPVTITGNLFGVCGQTISFSCPTVLNATSYQWSVPANATIMSGQGTNTVSVKFNAGFNTGTLSVYAQSGCGNSATFSKTIDAKPGQPVISGSNFACQNQTGVAYSVAPVFGATSYTWQVVAGSTLVSGQGTTAIVVNWGAINGVITCKANDACGSGLPGQKPVSFTCKEDGSLFDFTEINLYPNPASTSATVQFDAFTEGEGQLQIYDVIGQQMLQEDLKVLSGNNQYSIDLNTYPKGTYIVKVIYKGFTRNCKLVVK